MPSPFPGMDPYLERHWEDVHADLVALTRAALNATLPGGLVARMEERVVIDSIHYDRPRAIFPHVRVYEDPNDPTGGAPAAPGAGAVAQPIVLEVESEEHTETYLTILDPDGGELITVVEFLSPSNKQAGDAREQYRRKRGELREAGVNLVGIDLIRQGPWRELLLPLVAPGRVPSAYRVVTYRAHPPRRVEFYPISLRQRLPVIPVPLRPSDQPVTLDLQPIVDSAYHNGRYNRTRYDRPCEPALEGDDATWADELLRSAGRR